MSAETVPAANEPPPVLQLRDVTVYRNAGNRQVRLLDRLTLEIPHGCHTAILGPNGSGKTSLLKLLSRRLYPSVVDGHVGRVEIFGLSEWNVHDLQRRMGIISGELDREFSLPRSGRMTALEAVLSGFESVELISFTETADAKRIEAATEALARLGVEALAGRTLMTLSTGERRRVLIARALVHRPEVLVLDEPTSGLDIAAAAAFLDDLRELAGRQITVVLVTHHVEEIIPEIEHLVLLKNGRVASAGKTREQLEAARLSDLFGIDVTIQRSDDGRFTLHRR